MNQVVLDHLMTLYPSVASDGFDSGDRNYLKEHLGQVQQAVRFLHQHTRRCSTKQGIMSSDLAAALEQEYETLVCEGAIIIAAISLYMPFEQINSSVQVGVRIL